MSVDPPLHQLEPTRRFTDRAADYVRWRPDYPAAAFDAMLEGLDPARLHAADVGAGTGISSRQLADRGLDVVAVEPNAAMREAAAPHPRVRWAHGTAEATGLPAESVGLVLAAQAFHWFQQPEAVAEFHRILVPDGRLALMWNERERADPLTRGYIEAIHAVGGEHPAERRAFDAGVVDRSGRFGPVRAQRFAHAQRLDREGLLGRALSASYVPREDGPRAQLEERLSALFDTHREADDRVTMRYLTRLYLARRR